jgi:hypothetical protein
VLAGLRRVALRDRDPAVGRPGNGTVLELIHPTRAPDILTTVALA